MEGKRGECVGRRERKIECVCVSANLTLTLSLSFLFIFSISVSVSFPLCEFSSCLLFTLSFLKHPPFTLHSVLENIQSVSWPLNKEVSTLAAAALNKGQSNKSCPVKKCPNYYIPKTTNYTGKTK